MKQSCAVRFQLLIHISKKRVFQELRKKVSGDIMKYRIIYKMLKDNMIIRKATCYKFWI